MTTINRHALTQYSVAQMYALINDIEAYPEFLQWCRSAEIIERDEDTITAKLELVKGRVHKEFTTRNKLISGKLIEMKLVEGPFHHLEGSWRFEPLTEDACKVILDLDFDFKNSMLAIVMEPVFTQVANTLVDSFVSRAGQIYERS